mmetsp:Transcript_13760/g.17947  ORF Transcript_13760/g.17947 Transcript_13760/m.17947 type:complete len:84 (+) Transcript_13760:110-361(+)
MNTNQTEGGSASTQGNSKTLHQMTPVEKRRLPFASPSNLQGGTADSTWDCAGAQDIDMRHERTIHDQDYYHAFDDDFDDEDLD